MRPFLLKHFPKTLNGHHLDRTALFLEAPVLDELVHAVDRETANHIGVEIERGSHTHCMCTNNLSPSKARGKRRDEEGRDEKGGGEG